MATVTLKDLEKLQNTFENEVSIYLKLSASSDITNFTKIEPATVEDPVDELAKICVLLHLNMTKLGLVLRYPFEERNYSASHLQLKDYVRNFTLLVSLLAQMGNENKYSEVFTKKVVSWSNTLFLVNQLLCAEISKILKVCESGDKLTEKQSNDLDNERLVAVGKIWNTCDLFKLFLQDGELGLLKKELSLSVSMMSDAQNDLKNWIENPIEEDEDPFGLDDFSDGEEFDDMPKPSSGELDDKVDIARKWATKIKLVQILFSVIGKTVSSLKTERVSLNNTTLDKLHSLQTSTVECVDDLVASMSMTTSLEDLSAIFDELQGYVDELEQLLKELNGMVKDNKKLIALQESWTEKYH